MLKPAVLVVMVDPGRAVPRKIAAVKLIRALGYLRPDIQERFSLMVAKRIADALLDHRASVAFAVAWGNEALARPALEAMFVVVDGGEGDLAADDVWVDNGLQRLELFANYGNDPDLKW